MSWMVFATSGPTISAASVSAMSMPALTPAAVTIFPRRTTRSFTGIAPRPASSPFAAQCVVASTPFSTPAPARSSDPVHTDVVHVVFGCALAIHGTIG
jgi:hypothetical protein